MRTRTRTLTLAFALAFVSVIPAAAVAAPVRNTVVDLDLPDGIVTMSVDGATGDVSVDVSRTVVTAAICPDGTDGVVRVGWISTGFSDVTAVVDRHLAAIALEGMVEIDIITDRCGVVTGETWLMPVMADVSALDRIERSRTADGRLLERRVAGTVDFGGDDVVRGNGRTRQLITKG